MHRTAYESFQRLLRRRTVGLTGKLHTCRHTAATNMLQAGVPLNDVTAKVYAHVIPRGGHIAWTPPRGLRGLDLLEAWYSRSAEAGEDDLRGTEVQSGA